ncbi:MAG: hypothetical protein WCQ11_05320 [Actinomycetes bacterium]
MLALRLDVTYELCGDILSKRNKSAAPLAPIRVKFFSRLKLRRQGRQDSRISKGVQDFTRTHALIVAQSLANAGQRTVNQWYIEAMMPLLTGNSRIKVHRASVEQRISELQSKFSTLTGRQQKRTSVQMSSLEQELVNLKSQYRANITTADSFEAEADQALDSWKSFYNEMAAIYTRARSRKSRKGQATAASEVPLFESIPLAELKEVRQRDWDLDSSTEDGGK